MAPRGAITGHGANTVAVGQLQIMIGINDLQIPKSDQQQGHHAHDDVGDYRESRLRKTILTFKN